jgi:hypothetical protein
VINELHRDGDTVIVHFSNGPEAFKSRWEGRPKTPPFRWGTDRLIGATDEDWLEEGMDMNAFGVDDLVNESLAQVSPDAKDQDVKATHGVLVKFGGILQAMFKYYESHGDFSVQAADKMTLEQFRQCMRDAKVTNNTFKPDNVDECFSEVQPRNLKGAGKKSSNDSSVGIEAFFIAILRVAARKYDMGKENGFAELNMRLSHFITTHLLTTIAPIFQKSHDALAGCLTNETQLLLRKGRRLTMQTLDSCQLRRVAQAERRLDVKYLSHHAIKWGILSTEKNPKTECISFLELARLVIFAKQPGSQDVTQYAVHNAPYELNYDEFERFLAALAFHTYNKPGGGPEGGEREEPFVEFLGEFLDDIFRRSGVLLELNNDD